MARTQRPFRLAFVVFAAPFVLTVPALVFAQASLGSGRLEGNVADATGAFVPGARVTARNARTGITTAAASDANGHFVFLTLEPGSYQIEVAKQGFENVVLKDVTVNVGTTTTVRPQLAVGDVRQTVTVTAAVPLVDTKQSALSTVVDESSIRSLPLNGRNFTDFALLTPGATTDGDFGMVSFNGMPATSTTTRLTA
jgi:carboxypeptidase family protein